MGRKLTPEDRDIWAKVAAHRVPRQTAQGRAHRRDGRRDPVGAEGPAPLRQTAQARPVGAPARLPSQGPVRTAHGAPDPLEPRRHRRIARERDPIEATLDLHGFGRFEAQDQVTAFLTASQARGLRAVLLITGQGRRGGGVIRASIHEWLQGPGLRGVVSGFAAAHRRHGGDGAIYVTLKRRG